MLRGLGLVWLMGKEWTGGNEHGRFQKRVACGGLVNVLGQQKM